MNIPMPAHAASPPASLAPPQTRDADCRPQPASLFGLVPGVWTSIAFLDPHVFLWFPSHGAPFELEDARALHAKGLIVRATKRIDGILHVVAMPSRMARERRFLG